MDYRQSRDVANYYLFRWWIFEIYTSAHLIPPCQVSELLKKKQWSTECQPLSYRYSAAPVESRMKKTIQKASNWVDALMEFFPSKSKSSNVQVGTQKDSRKLMPVVPTSVLAVSIIHEGRCNSAAKM